MKKTTSEHKNSKILQQQIGQFINCLRERKYDADVFEKKMEAVIQRILKQDEYCNEEVVDFFQRNLQDYQDFFEKDTETRLFFAGWMLTFLSIHAMSEEQMTAPTMQKLDRNSSFSFKALWGARQDVGNRKAEEVHFLTNWNNALCITPLPMMRFFGRERELFDLRELLEKGGCYLLSGMGGIGKTELLRQLLRLCTEQGLVDEITVIQYEGNLADSCLNAFPNVRGENREGILQEALARIRIREDKRVLTLVDNVNNTLEEDPALAKLCTLPGTVLLTSRLAEMEGFTTYDIKAPGKETGSMQVKYLAESSQANNFDRRITVVEYTPMEVNLMDAELSRFESEVKKVEAVYQYEDLYFIENALAEANKYDNEAPGYSKRICETSQIPTYEMLYDELLTANLWAVNVNIRDCFAEITESVFPR